MATRSVPTLQTDRLTLRAFDPSDAPRLQALLADGRIAEGTLRIPHPYPEGGAAEWIATHPELVASGKLMLWAVTMRNDGDLVGSLSLRLSAAHRRGEAGYWIAPAVWGRGLATEALRAVVAYGFDVLDLHRIEGHHFTENPPSGRVMAKVGCVTRDASAERCSAAASLATSNSTRCCARIRAASAGAGVAPVPAPADCGRSRRTSQPAPP